MKFGKNPDLRSENNGIYGLIEIIYCAGAVALDNVLIFVVISGQKDDRYVGSLPSSPDHLGQLKPRHSRHADVEDEEGEFIVEQRMQRFFRGCRPNQPVIRIVQDSLQDGQIFRLIVNDQDVDGQLFGRPRISRSRIHCGSDRGSRLMICRFKLIHRMSACDLRRPSRLSMDLVSPEQPHSHQR